MRQHKQIFPLFFLLLVIILPLIVNQTKAITNYNYVVNGGFENQMARWNITAGSPTVVFGGSFAGDYHLVLDSNEGVRQYVGYDMSIDLIQNISVCVKSNVNWNLYIKVYYTDASDDVHAVDGGIYSGNVYHWYNCTINWLDAGKFVASFELISASGGGGAILHVDNFLVGAGVASSSFEFDYTLVDENSNGIPDYLEGGGGYDTWYSNMVITYMILFIFVIVPPLIIAFEFSKHDVDPFMGFIGGLCLTVPMAYIVHIIDLWVLFIFVLGLILMILAKLGAFNRF